jgi:hypothetical protein
MVGSPTTEKNPKGVRRIYSTGRMYDDPERRVRKTIRFFSPCPEFRQPSAILSCFVEFT